MTEKPPKTEPRPGLVIEYSYLWREQAEAGREEGAKDRPCAVVIAAQRDDGKMRVYVAPITTTPPTGKPEHTIELPAETKRRLGLDHRRSWIVTNDLNVFTWPGPDVRPVGRPGENRGLAYGLLPQNMTKDLVANIRERVREGQTKPISRDEASRPIKASTAPPSKDWNAKPPEKPKDIKPLPPRGPKKDRDR